MTSLKWFSIQLFWLIIGSLYLMNGFNTEEIDFPLNERNGSDLLTDRLCSSADYIFQKHFSEDYVQKLLMRGDMSEENIAVAVRRLKDAIHNLDNLEILMNSTDDSEEKALLDQIVDQYSTTMDEYVIDFQKVFGEVDVQALKAQPLTLPSYLNYLHN